MKEKFYTPINAPSLRLEGATHLTPVADHIGIFGRLTASRAIARVATDALIGNKIAGLEAEARVTRTKIAVTEAVVKGALAADAVKSIGALAVEIAVATGASQSTLATHASAERLAAVTARSESYCALDQRVQQGRLSQDNAAVLKSFEDDALQAQIEATNTRSKKWLNAIDLLSDRVLAGVVKSTEDIQ